MEKSLFRYLLCIPVLFFVIHQAFAEEFQLHDLVFNRSSLDYGLIADASINNGFISKIEVLGSDKSENNVKEIDLKKMNCNDIIEPIKRNPFIVIGCGQVVKGKKYIRGVHGHKGWVTVGLEDTWDDHSTPEVVVKVEQMASLFRYCELPKHSIQFLFSEFVCPVTNLVKGDKEGFGETPLMRDFSEMLAQDGYLALSMCYCEGSLPGIGENSVKNLNALGFSVLDTQGLEKLISYLAGDERKPIENLQIEFKPDLPPGVLGNPASGNMFYAFKYTRRTTTP